MLNIYLLGSAHEIVTEIGLQTKIEELHEYQGILQSSSFKADRLLMWTFRLISSSAINKRNSKRILGCNCTLIVHPRSTGSCYQDEFIPWWQSSPAWLWQSSTAARLPYIWTLHCNSSNTGNAKRKTDQYLLVCVLQLTAGNEEEVSGCQLLKGHIHISDGCIW